jgi:hypothetical protein
MDLQVGIEPVIDFKMRQSCAYAILIVRVLRGKIYFPVSIFNRFGIVSSERRASKSGKGAECENKPDCHKS